MDFTQIIITVITVAGSTGIWKFLETKYIARQQEKQLELENSDGMQYRDDLKSRVRNLETLLAGSADEKDQLRNQVLLLTAEVHALRVKVEYLEKENERFKKI
jgi:uncharacterized protein (DUF3084 family)